MSESKCVYCRNDLRTGDSKGVCYYCEQKMIENGKCQKCKVFEAEISRLRGIIEQGEKLLDVAKCPNCDGCGFTVIEVGGCDMDGENDTRECVQVLCQWCYEKDKQKQQLKGGV